VTFYHAYADESRQDSPRFMLYGLLLIPRGGAEYALQEACIELRQKHNWGTGEFKWEKVSNAKLHVYKDFVDLFFAHSEALFRCLVVDKQKVDYKTHHQGDWETAFYEFYYQAISRNLQPEHEYLVFTDNRQNRQSNRLTDLKAQINFHWLRRGATESLVRNIEPRDSKKVDFLQITDVLLGAVGYDIEERAESPAKVEMVSHIAAQIGCNHLRDHWGRDTRFNIWRFRFPDQATGE